MFIKLAILTIAAIGTSLSQLPASIPSAQANHNCSFFDTVKITRDQRFQNDSFEHKGLIIPPDLIGLYDYVLIDKETRKNVKEHYRACICKLKPCISICCRRGSVYNSTTSRCNVNNDHKWPYLNITYSDGTEQPTDILKHFEVQPFRPCNDVYFLEYGVDKFQIFENGSMIGENDKVPLHKNEYCLVPTVKNATDEYYSIDLLKCNHGDNLPTMTKVTAYAMLFSIPFKILTIAVYLAIPELRNQHGSSLVCYLTGLIIGYSCLVCTVLINKYISNTVCELIGFTAYYFFMAAFLWLSVISFDLWHNFRGTSGANRLQEKTANRLLFLLYSLYAWGLAAVFLIFTYIAQKYSNLPIAYKPGISSSEFCWLDTRTWSAMIYFFGPVLVIIFVNTIMFVMTALRIHKVQREIARIMAGDDSTRNLRTEKDKFGLFLRLFIVMGVTWSLEILSYIVGSDNVLAKMFYAPTICNAIQGFLIFMLFVMKKKVKRLITNRYFNRNRSLNQSTSTTSGSLQHSNGVQQIQLKES